MNAAGKLRALHPIPCQHDCAICQAAEELCAMRAAYEFVLPYLHVDIRAQAMAIYELKPTPLEKYIGSLGVTLQPDNSMNWECDRCQALTSTMLTRCYVCGTPRGAGQPDGDQP